MAPETPTETPPEMPAETPGNTPGDTRIQAGIQPGYPRIQPKEPPDAAGIRSGIPRDTPGSTPKTPPDTPGTSPGTPGYPWNTPRYPQIPPGYLQMPPDTPGYPRVPPGTPEYPQIPWDTPRYPWNTPRYPEIPPDTPRTSRIPPDTLGYPGVLADTPGYPQMPPACGRPRPPLPRNVGGEAARGGEWPWQGSLLRGGRHVCGAALVAPAWLLTAAHCLMGSRDPRDYAVLLGVQELAGPRAPGAAVPVGRLLPHPAYAGEATSGDIALAQLARPVAFSASVLPVCLPGPRLRFAPGTRCVVTGWGDISEGQDLPSPRRLQKLEVPIMAQATCRRLYGRAVGRGRPPRRIQDDMVCAGYPEGLKDTCKGDSGGPLVCRAGGRWVLAGIVSWGEGCAEPGRPGVYTRVSSYAGWIRRHVPALPFLPPNA
ncbi:serine protease 27-like, partial [Eudromia elegans]